MVAFEWTGVWVFSGRTEGHVKTKGSHMRLELVRNLMAHAQKPDFVFGLNGRVHCNRRVESVQSTAGSRGVRISGSNDGYTTYRARVRVLATHSIRQFPLHFPSRASPCATTFRTQYTVPYECFPGRSSEPAAWCSIRNVLGICCS